MNNDRRAILSLVAAGRITAQEAERLLALWNDDREWLWGAVLCLLAGMAHVNWSVWASELGKLIQTVPSGPQVLQHGVALLSRL